ncbi:protein NPGR1 isoform X1 [Beta vulgaris subsp. vulgaris]|uniref:protein NPGR1 isoform X1 n=2 Tax=Beta vulgaris subsp. vulgaris TaxID=3555 RepID=UPI0020372525|nr:protein NPGR1 isoform X1 [Beta vulgaris subsp. vulgaris]
MLCACSGEQFRFEEAAPRSPESLATRDYSVSGLSSRTGDLKSFSSRTTGDLGSKYEDAHVDEVESTLKEALSLNYEEARALLGRIEYQKANFDAALQLFEGIDIKALTPRMINAISERTRPRKPKSKGDNSLAGVMSWHSVSLLLEAILLKSKVLEELGRISEAARECKMIVDIVESALPNGMPAKFSKDSRMQEMLHKALELLPKLWKEAGCLDEAIVAYRQALVKPWNLDPETLASAQKKLAAMLIYGGVEVGLPPQLQIWGPSTPRNNLEEAILLLFILIRKASCNEIEWDPEIMDHLSFALSMCNSFEFLANHVEQVLPGVYNRAERWYILALCYSAAGQNKAALDLVRKITGPSESKQIPHIPSLLLGAKLCTEDLNLAQEGINYCRKVTELAGDGNKHFMAQAHKFLGRCYSNAARVSISNLEREMYRKGSLKSLNDALPIAKDDPELIFNLGLENAAQRNLDASFSYTKLYSNMLAGSSGKGWKLLALVASAQQQFEDAEDIVDIALDETTGIDRLQLLRLKAVIQIAQENPKQAIENYVLLLAQIQAAKKRNAKSLGLEATEMKLLEMEAWQDLSTLYTRLESWGDAEICVERAKSINFYSPQSWHVAGKLFKARQQYKEALLAFSVSLSIDPNYVPGLVSAAEVFMELAPTSLPIAKSFLMNALQLDPTNHDAWLHLGLILKKEGLITQAADCFQAACELKSTVPIQSFL